MLVSMADILQRARKERYGVAAPNVHNEATVERVFQVSEELRSPLIIDVGAWVGIEKIASFCKYYNGVYPNAVVALNLDHGKNYADAVWAIRCGYTSVMFDRSAASFEENIADVSEIVKMAHAVGVSVEAELGQVGHGYEYEKTRDAGLTKLEDAKEYVQRTGVDCLAVAVGSSHGVYSGIPHLEFKLLEGIFNAVDVPLVMHGGSGTGDENLRRAVKTGISKVNIRADLFQAGYSCLKEFMETGNVNLADAEKATMAGWKKMLVHYVELFDSSGKI